MSFIVHGKTGQWEVVIGMEVHAQITAESKLFSGASAEFGAAPNSHVAFLDAGMPGQLPVLNRYCVEQAVKTGLGLKAEIHKTSIFERKNYFYPDLPTGYQISQFEHPIVGKGVLNIQLKDGSEKQIGITRLHMEQDAGKSIHDQHPQKSFVDLNRAGCALMEIVSEPDIRGPEEAAAYISKLRMILQYLGTCDGNMESGSMRADVNLSVRKVGETQFGTRTETKNVNSIRAIQQVIHYEAERQVAHIENGQTVNQETRLWDPDKLETRSMRSKEEAHDYRYFPCPDLPALTLEDSLIERLQKDLPELPDEKHERFIKDYHLTAYDADILISEQSRAEFFEIAAKGNDPKMTSNWVINELLGALNKESLSLEHSKVSAEQLGALVGLIENQTISGKIAKDVLAEMIDSGKDPSTIIDEKGLKQMSDTSAIDKIIDDIMAQNDGQVQAYRGGKEKLFGFFVGQVMKATKGQANPAIVNQRLKEKLKK